MNTKTIGKKSVVTATIALAMIAGAAGIGSMFSRNQANAQTATPAVTAAAPATTTPAATGNTGSTVTNPSGGTFHSNEDPAHEAKESAAREAQEDAGQRPTVQ